MENTSMGYHTFAFFQKTDEEEYQVLENDFIGYMQRTKKLKRSPVQNKDKIQIGWQYTYKDDKEKGIHWLMLSSKAKNNYVTRGVLAVINQEALIENNYIRAAKDDDLKEVEEIYNRETEKISKIFLKFGSCSLNRVDPCLNIDLKELGIPCTPEQMMKLIKRGNIPRYYEERKECYDSKQRRMVSDKNSFYLESKSSVINFYWKYAKQGKKHPNYSKRESSRNVIRLEVECKYLKLYALVKNRNRESKYYESAEGLSIDEMYMRMYKGIYNPVIPIDVVLSANIYEPIIRKSIYKILRKGNYFTLDIARDIVESYHFRSSKEERMIEVLESVNESHGIAKAKSKLREDEFPRFNKALKELDKILVNPVTIPRRWDIKHIPNLLRAYYDSIYEEQLVSYQEYAAMKRIEEVLEKVKQ
jgi:hypothetical protein